MLSSFFRKSVSPAELSFSESFRDLKEALVARSMSS